MKHLVIVMSLMALIAMCAAPASAGLLYLAEPAGGPDAQLVAEVPSGGIGGSLGGSLVTTLGTATPDPTPGPVFDGPSVGYVVQPESVPAVPEPGTLALVGTSLLGLFGYMRRRRD